MYDSYGATLKEWIKRINVSIITSTSRKYCYSVNDKVHNISRSRNSEGSGRVKGNYEKNTVCISNFCISLSFKYDIANEGSHLNENYFFLSTKKNCASRKEVSSPKRGTFFIISWTFQERLNFYACNCVKNPLTEIKPSHFFLSRWNREEWRGWKGTKEWSCWQGMETSDLGIFPLVLLFSSQISQFTLNSANRP